MSAPNAVVPIALRLKDVALSYPVPHASELSLNSAVRRFRTGGRIHKSGRSVNIVALEDMNLTVRVGERIGIIGHNGAGKTTLLKVISGIYRPQQGHLERYGRLAAVINPGNGLHMELTGYENIENLGLLSGLKLSEVRSHMPDIEEFTELGDYLSLPVGTYSTGMMTRLAFAVATALSPDILVADENLATGDSRFVERARDRMNAMIARSGTLVIASHDLDTLKSLVDRLILLDGGRIVADGPFEEVVEAYHSMAHRPESGAEAGGPPSDAVPAEEIDAFAE
ncbi:ABC transporter ATP-binding protein [Mangrovibrevibacter kandeliae]|uniref:ABC transporter ATP-binding protein n=1 Tax=Mangrovibrevibacter kandeliae TaxID=2968473 RepID=UPI002117E3BE|nr:ATP-binding cassette domain-containing protein [Aurantimonas sp. CSK15Z-1]MCQ8782813.1 ATP-binding cassette domain-containing protein [Aurantimonas sp. CSK15Z-1]